MLETLRTARGSQLLELSHSGGCSTYFSLRRASASRTQARRRMNLRCANARESPRPGGVRIPQLCDGITCYDDKTLKEEGVDAVVRSAFNSARSLEADVFRDLEEHLFQKCLKATKQNRGEG